MVLFSNHVRECHAAQLTTQHRGANLRLEFLVHVAELTLCGANGGYIRRTENNELKRRNCEMSKNILEPHHEQSNNSIWDITPDLHDSFSFILRSTWHKLRGRLGVCAKTAWPIWSL